MFRLDTLVDFAHKLVTVVPLSTVEPKKIESYHYRIPKKSMPMLDKFQSNDSWLNGVCGRTPILA
jgi:uncharacterized protein YifN (PemK superfamily)